MRAVCLVLVLLAGALAHAAPFDRPARTVGVLLDDGSKRTRAGAIEGIRGLGGTVVHAFDDVLVASLPAGTEMAVYRLPGVREIAFNAIAARGLRSRLTPGIAAWNAIVRAGERDSWALAPPPAGASPLAGDGLLPPPIGVEAVGAAQAAVSGPGPFGATDLNTSEFLAGTVSVNVLLVESDGIQDTSTENWSLERESAVIGEIAEGLEWIRKQEPQAGLAFVYHVISGRTDPRARTRYEPIKRSADPGGTTGEDLWAKEVLGKLGYASGDRFARARALAATTRGVDGSDWAVTVFVVDSLNDADGKFVDGRFAYAWIGGPHLVLTYDNQAWGIDRMDMVFRHELLHSFYAFDEYGGSGCTCTEHRGYLDGLGSNCASCNASAVPCVMISNGDALCSATRRQIGWADLDADGVIDVVGEDPDTFLEQPQATWCGAPSLGGVASVVAATNRNPSTVTPKRSISVNRIASVSVRADGAPWDAAEVSFALPQTSFAAGFPGLPPGAHRLEARAVDDRGNLDATPAFADVLVAAQASRVESTLSGAPLPGGAARFDWAPAAGAVLYRVFRAALPQGPWSASGESSGTTWTEPAGGTIFLRVRAVDACGDESGD